MVQTKIVRALTENLKCPMPSLFSVILLNAVAVVVAPAALAGTTVTQAPSPNSRSNTLVQTTQRKSRDGTKSKQAVAQNEPTPQQLSAVTVTGVVGSLMRSTAIKRNNISIVDSISAEQVGTFPDQTVAGALQRVPGVSVNRSVDGEPNQITVRGLGPTFVDVLLNGSAMATTGKTRAFNLDVLPVELLEKAVVIKTSQASLPAGGIGGTVNIVTWHPLEFTGFHASGRFGGMKNTIPGHAYKQKIKPRASMMLGNTTSDGRFGWLFAATFQQRDEQFTDWANTGGWFARTFPLVSTTRQFFAPSDDEVDYATETRTKQSSDLSVEWQPTDTLDMSLNALLSRVRGKTRTLGADVYLSPGVVDSVTADANNTVTSLTTNGNPAMQVISKPVSDNINTGLRAISFKLNYHLTESDSLKFNVTNSLAKTIDFHRKGVAGYHGNDGVSMVFHNPPSANVMPYYTGGLGFTDLAAFGTHLSAPARETNSDHVGEYNLSLTHSFISGPLDNLKFGLYRQINTFHSMSFGMGDNGNLAPNAYNGFHVIIPPHAVGQRIVKFPNIAGKYGAHQPHSLIDYSLYQMLDFLSTPTAYDQLPPAKRQKLINGYLFYRGFSTLYPHAGALARVHEDDRAAYFQAKFDTSIDSHKLIAQVGLRYVHTRTVSSTIGNKLLALTGELSQPDFATQVLGENIPLSTPGAYHYLLPSVNIALNIARPLVLRAAYSKTLTRPPLANLGASKTYGTQGRLTETAGNPKLRPFLSTNFDAGLTWYLSSISYVSVDAFQKDIKNFVTVVTTQVPASQVVPKIGPIVPKELLLPGFFVTRPINLNKAKIKGEEITVNYSFKFLPGWLRGFGVQTNYTHVTSSASSIHSISATGSTFAVPGIGSSYNVSLYYQNSQFNGRLSYNERKGYLESVAGKGGQPVNAKSFGELDLSLRFHINKHVGLFFDATNLTNETVFQYQEFLNRPFLASTFGRRFTFGVQAKL